MKILHICNTDLGGGAGIAAYRLHRALLDAGYDSLMFVDDKRSADPTVMQSSSGLRQKWRDVGLKLERFKLKRASRETGAFWSTSRWPSFNVKCINDINADIVHIHWTNLGMLSTREIARIKAKKIVWSLHDMWAFSGGCHYFGNLDEQVMSAVVSRQLKSDRLIKERLWSDLPLTWVPLSNWMEAEFRRSRFCSKQAIQMIWNSVPTHIFQPRDQCAMREKLKIFTEGKVFLFGAVNPHRDLRKGGDLLEKAILSLPKFEGPENETPWFVAFGGKEFHYKTENGYVQHGLGKLVGDDCLAEVYASADLFLCPSRVDNLPNTCVEAIASGLPVLAFDVGGLSDIVVAGHSGYLVQPFDLESFSDSLCDAIHGRIPSGLPAACRQLALERFSPEKQLKQMLKVYRGL